MLNYPKRILYNLFTEEIYLFQPAYFSLGNKRVGKQNSKASHANTGNCSAEAAYVTFSRGAF